jgi:hypothetical protein
MTFLKGSDQIRAERETDRREGKVGILAYLGGKTGLF